MSLQTGGPPSNEVLMIRVVWVSVVCLLTLAAPSAQQPSIDDFFRTISDGWVRLNPNLAVATRYFSGDEQDRLEQQISSYTDAAERERLAYIQRGLQDLGRFDRSRMTDAQRLSADVLRYHLQSYSTGRSTTITSFRSISSAARTSGCRTRSPCSTPFATAKDVSNYVVAARPGRTAHGRGRRRVTAARREGSDSAALHPEPDDRSDAPLRGDAAGAESIRDVARRACRRDTKSSRRTARAALVAQAERIVRESVYPEWNKAIAFLETLVPRSADRAGLWRLEGGAAAYTHFLKALHDDGSHARSDPRDRPAQSGRARAQHGRRSCASSADRMARSRNVSRS